MPSRRHTRRRADRTTPLGANETVTFKATGNNGQCAGIAADAQAIEVQLTATETSAASYVTAFPANLSSAPNVSHLNTRPGEVISNSTIISLSPTGEFKVYNFTGTTNVIIDVLAVFSPGAAGGTGPAGPQGPAGPAGSATYVGPEWGTVLRNTKGSASASLRGGPFVALPGGTTSAPPLGQGSLELLVGDGSSIISFGNESDFFGDAVADLDAVGYHVYTTGENGCGNLPSITFEINPGGAGGTAATYSSMVWIPGDVGVTNQWSGYIDATTTGLWGLTGGQFNGTPDDKCGLNGGLCTFEQMQTFLGTGATILTAAVNKGRDHAFQGAVDGLRINDTVYDFEPFGVYATPASS